MKVLCTSEVSLHIQTRTTWTIVSLKTKNTELLKSDTIALERMGEMLKEQYSICKILVRGDHLGSLNVDGKIILN
jgi:hypothetical protein